ncbi:MAG: hypothetical protein HY842_11045 [Bacteroidetes bacterium]|nr:hypothetical protein [Bacteroidota bacterium]
MQNNNRLLPTFFTAIALTFLFACGPGNSSENTTQADRLKTDDPALTIDTFSTFPPEIDGCACYFSNDEAEFKSGKYIYADNYEKTAFVSLHGAMTKFEMKSDTSMGERTVKTFANDQYEVTIDMTKVGQIDETWQQKGTMTIKANSGQTISKNIYGECGC